MGSEQDRKLNDLDILIKGIVRALVTEPLTAMLERGERVGDDHKVAMTAKEVKRFTDELGKPDIFKLELRPGDIVVLKHPSSLSMEAADNVNRTMETLLKECGLNNRVMILEEGMDINILDLGVENGKA